MAVAVFGTAVFVGAEDVGNGWHPPIVTVFLPGDLCRGCDDCKCFTSSMLLFVGGSSSILIRFLSCTP